MIDFIKEYGLTSEDYNIIVHNIKTEVIETIALSEQNTREVLAYYNELGITQGLVNVFINRPDLIIIPREVLEELFSKIEPIVLSNAINKSIKDLIVLGI